ncbi:hypothetical protein Sste5344_004469 [Sporothrix stenoceras]
MATSTSNSSAGAATSAATPSGGRAGAPPVTRRRSSRANDSDPPMTPAQSYAAAYRAALEAEELAKSQGKGGHSLRKRTRVDYQHMDNGDTSATSTSANGEEAEQDNPTSVSAAEQIEQNEQTPSAPATRGRKRKTVHIGFRTGNTGEDEVASPPSPAMATKKIRLVHHQPASTEGASTNGTSTTATANGHAATSTPAATVPAAKASETAATPTPTPRGRGRPPNRRPNGPAVGTQASGASTAGGAPASGTGDTASPMVLESPSGGAIVVHDTIRVGGSPPSSDTEADNSNTHSNTSSAGATPPLQRSASSNSVTLSSSVQQSNIAKAVHQTAAAPSATSSTKAKGPTSAPSTAAANGHTPGKVGRPRRQSTAAAAAAAAVTSTPTKAKAASADTSPASKVSLSKNVSPQKRGQHHRSRSQSQHRLMVRIPRGRNRSPPSVYHLQTAADQERFDAFMEARANDAKAGAAVLPSYESFDSEKTLKVEADNHDSEETVAKVEPEETPAAVDSFDGATDVEANKSTDVASGEKKNADADVEMEDSHALDMSAADATTTTPANKARSTASDDVMDDAPSPVAFRSMTRRTSTRIASAAAQKELAILEAHEQTLKEQKAAKAAAKAKAASSTASTSAPTSAHNLFATGRNVRRPSGPRSWESLTPFENENVFYPEQFYDNVTMATTTSLAAPSATPNPETSAETPEKTESAEQADQADQADAAAAEQSTPLPLAKDGIDTPVATDLEAALQEKIAADTRLEEAAAAAAAAGTSFASTVATPDIVIDSATGSNSATPAPPTPIDLPTASADLTVAATAPVTAAATPNATSEDLETETPTGTTSAPAANAAAATSSTPTPGRKPMWKKQYRFNKIRDPKEFVDALKDHKDMSTDDLFACLAHMNDTLLAWQEEYKLLRGIADDEENAVRRRQQDATFENRTLMALKRGNVDTEITERDFVVKGIRAPESLADPIKRHARQQDRLMSHIYLFEHDPRDSMISRQDPVAQREGLQNTRLRNRPKQTLKAAEAEALDDGMGVGRRTRRNRKAALDDESGEGSRAGTPVPTSAPTVSAPAPTTATPANPPVRGRRGRPPGPATLAAKAAAAEAAAQAAAAAAAEGKTDDDDAQTDSAATSGVAQTPTKRGRRGRVPRSQLSESVAVDDLEEEKPSTAATSTMPYTNRRASAANMPPPQEKPSATTSTTVSPLAGGPGRKRRRGRKPNSLLRQEAAEAAAAAAAAKGEAGDEDGEGDDDNGNDGNDGDATENGQDPTYDDGDETATESPQHHDGRGHNGYGSGRAAAAKRQRTSVLLKKDGTPDLRRRRTSEIGPRSFYSTGRDNHDEPTRPGSSASSNGNANNANANNADDSSYALRPKRRRKFRAVHNGVDDEEEQDEQKEQQQDNAGEDTTANGPPTKKQKRRRRTTTQSIQEESANTSMQDVGTHQEPQSVHGTPAPQDQQQPYPPPMHSSSMPYDPYAQQQPPHPSQHQQQQPPPPYGQQQYQNQQQQPPVAQSQQPHQPHQPPPPHHQQRQQQPAPYYGHGPMDGHPSASAAYYGHHAPPPPPPQQQSGYSMSPYGQPMQAYQSQPMYYGHGQPPPPPQQAYHHQPPPHQQGPPGPPGPPGLPQSVNNLAPAPQQAQQPPAQAPAPPSSGRQRTTFKIKNYTPAPVAPSAGVHAFTQMMPNAKNGPNTPGSHRHSLGGAPSASSTPMVNHTQFVPHTPSGPGSDHGGYGSPGVGGTPGGPPGGSGGPGSTPGADGDDKDYRQMTKSEKMSHSMKTRWANGSMQAAVAKRKATLAAKKAAAQQAQQVAAVTGGGHPGEGKGNSNSPNDSLGPQAQGPGSTTGSISGPPGPPGQGPPPQGPPPHMGGPQHMDYGAPGPYHHHQQQHPDMMQAQGQGQPGPYDHPSHSMHGHPNNSGHPHNNASAMYPGPGSSRQAA